jgi:O-antigen/teichoic acid export membrane protein
VVLTPRAAQVLVALGTTPFIVDRVGLAAFGLWSLVQTFVAFLVLADFGFPVTTMRLIARARARGRVDEIHAALNITMALMLAVAVVALLLALTAASVSDELWSDAPAGTGWLLRWTGIGLALTFVTKGLSVVPQGLNRWDIQAMNQLAGQLVWTAAVIAALLLGAGLAALGLSFALAGVTTVALGYLQARRLLTLRWGRKYFDRGMFRTIRRQGANLFVVGLVEATSLQADKFLLLPFASLRFIGLYALGSRVAYMVRLFAVSVLGPLSTRVAAIEGHAGMAGVREYYPVVLRKTIFTCALPMVFVACAGYPGVLAWLGGSYETSALVGVLLGLAFAVNMLTGAGTATAAACGRADIDRKYSLINLGLNIVLTVILALTFGRWGVLAGTVCGLAGSSWILLRDVDRWLGIRGFSEAVDRHTRRAVLASTAVGIAGVGVTMWVHSSARAVNLLLAAGILLAMGAAALVSGGTGWRDLRDARLRVGRMIRPGREGAVGGVS